MALISGGSVESVVETKEIEVFAEAVKLADTSFAAS
jgi:hypothetical protein